MPGPEFIPILPKHTKLPSNPDLAVQHLRNYALRVQSMMKHYPGQRAHVRYKRTGAYGRGWSIRGPRGDGKDVVVTIGTNVRYAGIVGGYKTSDPRQARWATAYGWRSVENVHNEIWDAYKPRIRRALVEGR